MTTETMFDRQDALNEYAHAGACRSFLRRAVNADGRHRFVAAWLSIADAEALAVQADAHEARGRALQALPAHNNPAAPPFDVTGDHVQVTTRGHQWLTGTVTRSGEWGLVITSTDPHTGQQTKHWLTWQMPARTYLFTR